MIVGKIPWLNVLHLYLVFSLLFSIILPQYNSLVVPRSRAASWVRISVLGLYVFLPGLGPVGVSFLLFHTTHLFWKILPIFSLLGKQTLADLRQKRLISGRMYPSLTLRFLPPHSLSLCKVGLYLPFQLPLTVNGEMILFQRFPSHPALFFLEFFSFYCLGHSGLSFLREKPMDY